MGETHGTLIVTVGYLNVQGLWEVVMLDLLTKYMPKGHTVDGGYAMIRSAIEEMIRNGEISAGAKLPPLRAIAEVCGSSRSTVARAIALLQQQGLVVAKPGSGVFIAQEAQRSDVPVIYLCVHSAYLREAPELAFRKMRGMFHASRQIRLRPIVSPKEFEWDTHGKVGVVFFDENYMEDGFGDVFKCVQERSIPCCVGSACEGPLPSVRKYHRQAMELSTEHLLRLGHQHVALLNVCDGSIPGGISEEHRDGYLSAFRRLGLAHPPALYIEAAPEHRPESEQETVTALDILLTRSPSLTAIVCNNDARALLVLELLAMRGIRVPADVSVVGMDNVDKGERSSPPLTTVDNLSFKMGEAAVNYVIERILGSDLPLPKVYPRFVERASAAPPRKHALNGQAVYTGQSSGPVK
jgi:hypothetical protein